MNSSQLSQVAVANASFRSHVAICPKSPPALRPTAARFQHLLPTLDLTFIR